MSNLRPFQIVLLGIFAALAIGSLIMLGAYQASISQQSRTYGDSVVIWGTFDATAMKEIFSDVSANDRAFKVVSYEEFDADTFESQLISALAEGRGPDLIILSSESMVSLRSKLLPIPYETLSLRTFKDTYVDGAEIFTFPDGVYAVPLATDPLMFYWNRDVLAASGMAEAPRTWEDVVSLLVPNVASFDTRRTLLQTALAFGEYRNLVNPKAVLLTLAMQSGSRMVYFEEGQYEIALDDHIDRESKQKPLRTAMEFFTDFSNSNSPLYTWNRVQPLDKNAFLSGDLATYFGFASEYRDILDKNPNLNFDVALVPQGSTATIKRTFGHFYGFAIPQTASNPNGAYLAALTLTGPDYGADLADEFGMVSSRRDVIAAGALDPVEQAAMTSSLFARSWLDPVPEKTDRIFQSMVEDVVSNRVRIEEAVQDAVGRIVLEF